MLRIILVLLHLPSISFVHPAVLAQAFELRVGHAASRLVLQSSAEAEHPPALQQRGELGSPSPFLLVIDVTAGTSSQDGKLRDNNERDTRHEERYVQGGRHSVFCLWRELVRREVWLARRSQQSIQVRGVLVMSIVIRQRLRWWR